MLLESGQVLREQSLQGAPLIETKSPLSEHPKDYGQQQAQSHCGTKTREHRYQV